MGVHKAAQTKRAKTKMAFIVLLFVVDEKTGVATVANSKLDSKNVLRITQTE